MAEYRAYVGLNVHKDTMAAAVAWPGREDPEYRGLLANRSSSLKRLIRNLQGPDGEARTRWPGSILGIDPAKEPERARKAVESHLARARWMTEVGYRELAADRYPGTNRDITDKL